MKGLEECISIVPFSCYNSRCCSLDLSLLPVASANNTASHYVNGRTSLGTVRTTSEVYYGSEIGCVCVCVCAVVRKRASIAQSRRRRLKRTVGCGARKKRPFCHERRNKRQRSIAKPFFLLLLCLFLLSDVQGRKKRGEGEREEGGVTRE